MGNDLNPYRYKQIEGENFQITGKTGPITIETPYYQGHQIYDPYSNSRKKIYIYIHHQKSKIQQGDKTATVKTPCSDKKNTLLTACLCFYYTLVCL